MKLSKEEPSMSWDSFSKWVNHTSAEADAFCGALIKLSLEEFKSRLYFITEEEDKLLWFGERYKAVFAHHLDLSGAESAIIDAAFAFAPNQKEDYWVGLFTRAEFLVEKLAPLFAKARGEIVPHVQRDTYSLEPKNDNPPG